MTYGEFALLRVLREASSMAHLPIEILKEIIRRVNLRARVAYRRRLRYAEMYPVYSDDPHIAYFMHHGLFDHLWRKPRYGPGF